MEPSLCIADSDTGPEPFPERRAHPRRTVIHPTKVYDRRAEKYFAGQTSNLSEGGALLVVSCTMPIARGDRLDVGIDQGQVILRQTDLTPAHVVRVTPIDRFSQAVAVQFDQSVTASQREAA